MSSFAMLINNIFFISFSVKSVITSPTMITGAFKEFTSFGLFLKLSNGILFPFEISEISSLTNFLFSTFSCLSDEKSFLQKTNTSFNFEAFSLRLNVPSKRFKGILFLSISPKKLAKILEKSSFSSAPCTHVRNSNDISTSSNIVVRGAKKTNANIGIILLRFAIFSISFTFANASFILNSAFVNLYTSSFLSPNSTLIFLFVPIILLGYTQILLSSSSEQPINWQIYSFSKSRAKYLIQLIIPVIVFCSLTICNTHSLLSSQLPFSNCSSGTVIGGSSCPVGAITAFNTIMICFSFCFLYTFKLVG